MRHDERRAAKAAYRERKTVAGIYAIRCTATGQCWVGRAPDISKIQNRLWFTLRHGTNPHRSLQQAWSAHGEDEFVFERIEQLDDDLSDYARQRTLEDRLSHWTARLEAETI